MDKPEPMCEYCKRSYSIRFPHFSVDFCDLGTLQKVREKVFTSQSGCNFGNKFIPKTLQQVVQEMNKKPLKDIDIHPQK